MHISFYVHGFYVHGFYVHGFYAHRSYLFLYDTNFPFRSG